MQQQIEFVVDQQERDHRIWNPVIEQETRKWRASVFVEKETRLRSLMIFGDEETRRLSVTVYRETWM